MKRHTNKAALFAALAVTFDLIHDFMDQWGQAGWAAANKGLHGDHMVYLDGFGVENDQRTTPRVTTDDLTVMTATQLGRKADTHHVAYYTIGQLIASIAVTRLLGYRVSLRALVVGHVVVNGVTHWVIDRRAPLHKLAKHRLFDKEGYIQYHGKVLPNGKPEIYGPGTASFELDKSLHRVIGLASAAVTTALAVRFGRKKVGRG